MTSALDILVAGPPPLLDLIPKISPEFSSPYHLFEWCEIIEACARGGVRACCEVPIRHHKTETTIHGIAWLLIKDPTIRIIYMVADQEMANDRANRIRQVCETADTVLGTTIGPERGQNVKTSWRNSHGGGVITMSANQSKLGQDCDVLICDDPITEKTYQDPLAREAVDRAIGHYTIRAGRTGRRGSVIIVMSRWHPDDPIGRRRQRKAAAWRVVHAAAIRTHSHGSECEICRGACEAAANDNDEYAFAPDVMSLDEIRKRRAEDKERDPTERLFFAQLQNDPLPDELGLFRSPVLYDELPTGPHRTIIGADLRYSQDQMGGDYFAKAVIKIFREDGIDNGQRVSREVAYVVEILRARWDPAANEASLRVSKLTYPAAPIFSYMAGPEIGVAHYLAEHGLEVNVLPARYNKRVRAQSTIDRSNAGLIRFPANAPWLTGVVARIVLFSGHENAGDDDEIDALVSAIDGGLTGNLSVPTSHGSSRGGVVVA